MSTELCVSALMVLALCSNTDMNIVLRPMWLGVSISIILSVMTLAYSQQLTIDHVLNTCLNPNVCYKKLPASSYRQHCGPGTIGVPYSVEAAIVTSYSRHCGSGTMFWSSLRCS